MQPPAMSCQQVLNAAALPLLPLPLLPLLPLLLACRTRQEGIPDEFEVVYVGSLSADVDIMEQEVRARRP